MQHALFFIFIFAAMLIGGYGIFQFLNSNPFKNVNTTLNECVGWRKYFPLLVLVGVYWCISFFIQSLLPNSDWDGASAHLPMAKLIMEDGLWAIDPAIRYYFVPGGTHLLYALLLNVRANSALIPLNLLASIGTALATYSIAQKIWGKGAGIWALAVILATNLLWQLGTDIRVDGFLSLTSNIGVMSITHWLIDRKRPGLLIAAGVGFGLAIGIKYNILILLIPVTLVTIYTAIFDFRWRVTGTRYAAVISLLFFLVPSGAWYLRNIITVGAPFYPAYSDHLFVSKGGELTKFTPEFNMLQKNIAPELKQKFNGESAFLNVDFSTTVIKEPSRSLLDIFDLFFHPDLFTRKTLHFISPFLILGVFLPFIYRDCTSILFYIMTITSWLMLAKLTYLVRYSLFILPLFAAGAGAVISYLKWYRVKIVFAIALVLNLLINASMEWVKVVEMSPHTLFMGKISRLEWLSDVGYSGAPGMARLTNHINSMVKNGIIEPTTKVFMVGESKGGDLNINYMPDHGNNATPWLIELIRANGDLDYLAQTFEKQEIRLLIVNHGFLNWCLREAITNRNQLELALKSLSVFLDQYGHQIYNDYDIQLYNISQNGRQILN
jgi:4-amino-4-deoxy-L-arabinose transferase-like glycosyltransferase